VSDMNVKMKKLAAENNLLDEKANKLMLEKSKLVTEVKLNKEELHEKMRLANIENKMLRAKNTCLQDQLSKIKEEEEVSNTKADKISEFVSMMSESMREGSPGVDHLLVYSEADNCEVRKMKEVFGKILVNKGSNGKRPNDKNKIVKLVSSEGSKDTISIVLNSKEKKVDVSIVEEKVGKKILGIKFRQSKGKGWRYLKVEDGYIDAPASGWGDREYVLVIEEGENFSHLGQGCISTPGHARRQESNVREGPMFPPHLGGPRISTL